MPSKGYEFCPGLCSELKGSKKAPSCGQWISTVRTYRDPSRVRYLPICFCSTQWVQPSSGHGVGEQGWPLGLIPWGKFTCFPAGAGCGDGDTQEGVVGFPGCHGPPEPLCRAMAPHGILDWLVWYQAMDNRHAKLIPTQAPTDLCSCQNRDAGAVQLCAFCWGGSNRVFGSGSSTKTSLRVSKEHNFEITQVDSHCGSLQIVRSFFSPSVSRI